MLNLMNYVEKEWDTLRKRVQSKHRCSLHDAEDVIGELCVSLLKYGKAGLSEKEIPKYVTQAVYREAIKLLYQGRHNSSQKDCDEDIDGDIPLTFDQVFMDQLKHTKDPFEHLSTLEDANITSDLIDKHVANPSHRKLLQLIFIEGVSATEAQELVGVSPENRRVVISRFKDEVRGEYEDMCR